MIVFVDDTAGRLTALHFAPSETTAAYLHALRGHILAHGAPVDLYSDRHGSFRVNAKEATSGDGLTEFGRVLKRLDIKSICAHTPQAKGRVERINQILQDRLVKEMRLRKISGIKAANAYMPEFVKIWNASPWIRTPRDAADAHRPWTKGEAALDDALARIEERRLSKNLMFQYRANVYGVKTSGPGTALRGAKITLLHRLNGSMEVRYKDRVLGVTAFKTRPAPNPTNNHNRIWDALDKAHARHADMVLIHGGSPKGAERIAACWADNRKVPQIVFKPDWTCHKNAAPFKRNDAMLEVSPIGVIAFPGSGISGNLEGKAVPRLAFRYGMRPLMRRFPVNLK
ncbi:MAG: DUF2493 domain-containing protein [Alphaproteobacteria bacterium]|nr:DUF2493 domain-containing protein [Alphaproteobacteria bacterium]